MKLLGFTMFRDAAASGAKPLLAKSLTAKSLTAKSLGDIALVGSGVAMAASSVVFAGYMLTRGDHGPEVNGMQYLAVFGKPNGSSHPSGSSHPMVIDALAPTRMEAVPVASASPAKATAPAVTASAPTPAASPAVAVPNKIAGDGLDMAPTGSIARGAASSLAVDGFRLLAVEPGVAWLTNGSEIRVVRPGDIAPGIGRVASIEKRDGRWTLIDDSGAPMLTTGTLTRANGPSPFAQRMMIFGPNN